MKFLCPLAALAFALLMTACSSTQQAESGANTPSKAAALTERPGNIFNTRGKRKAQKPAEAAPAGTSEEAAPAADEPAPSTVPTEEQQKAAAALLAEQSEAAPAPAPTPAPSATQPAPAADTPEPEETPTLAPLSRGLRMGSIVPEEEAASSADAPPPAANSVELRGLRSPKLPTSLPMGIDGKLQNAQ